MWILSKLPKLIILGLLSLLVLVACDAAETVTPTVIPSHTPQPKPTSTATHTPTPTPTHTSTATVIPTSTSTHIPTPTLTPTPFPPLSIEGLRQGLYPGSEVVIEETLEPGVNYNRYVVSYRSEGLRIYALLTVPRGEKPENGWPVIIFNHGYIPPDVYRTTERYVAYVDGFARNGYIVFRSDYRGHGNSEGTARGAYHAPDYTIDIFNAVATMQMYPDADPDRIGMWGHSMGGSIILQVMVASDDVKAGVIWAGMVGSYPDILQWFSQRWQERGTPTPLPGTQARHGVWGLIDLYGLPEENPTFWESISATSYLEDLSGPVQIHHGTTDAVVPYVWSETLYAQLQDAGIVSEFYSYEGDNHNISVNFSSAMARSITFFDTYLKGD